MVAGIGEVWAGLDRRIKVHDVLGLDEFPGSLATSLQPSLDREYERVTVIGKLCLVPAVA